MKLTTLAVAVAATVAFAHSAEARVHHHYRHHYRHEARRHVFRHERWARRDDGHRWDEGGADAMDHSRDESYRGYRHVGYRFAADPHYARRRYSGGYGPRPRAWCGWEMRQLVSSDPGPSYNLARNWAHWGHAGRVGVGAVVVWAHHVGKIVGREDGEWVVESGNDGHRLRTRPRSIAGAIAIRWG
jgi:hypothetical protein